MGRGWIHHGRDKDREMLTNQRLEELSVQHQIQDDPKDLVHGFCELTNLWVTLILQTEFLCLREIYPILRIYLVPQPHCLPG